jgi:heme-degrading monooxygenase HmoA
MHPAVPLAAADLRLEIETVAPSSAHAPTLSVQSSFLVSKQHTDDWIRTWRELAAIAEAAPGCRHFRLVRDRNDAMYFAIYSEWDDVASYAAFEHQTRVKEQEEELLSMSFLQEARCLEVIPVRAAEIRHHA